MVRKDWASQNSIALSWQEPAFPNGAILDYEIKYYEKVGLDYNKIKPLNQPPILTFPPPLYLYTNLQYGL